MLPQNGTAMRFVGDAVKPLLLPGTSARERCESGNDLFSDTFVQFGDHSSNVFYPDQLHLYFAAVTGAGGSASGIVSGL
jgi:hypothetical protein